MTEIIGPDPIAPSARGFVNGLRDLGWIDGRSIARGVDVIVPSSARWLHDSAQQATRTIPIVAVFEDDPVSAGLVSSLVVNAKTAATLGPTIPPSLLAQSTEVIE